MKNSLVALTIIIVILVSSVAGYAVGTAQSVTTIQYSTVTSFYPRTLIVVTNTTSTSTTCTNTGGLGCPHFFNQTYVVSVGYSGAWGVSYQGYLGSGTSGAPVESGSFYGHGATNESVTVSGTDTYGITLCVQAQKLDASNSMLVLRILPPDVVNQTSLSYGTTKACIAYAIV